MVAALIKADENDDSDLVGTLSGDGPFTVFAPTNDAFTELLQNLDGFDSLDDFDSEEERALLATILQYHVVAGIAAASTDLSDGQMITTVQGEDVEVNLDEGVFISDATDIDAEVILADVNASNGRYYHAIMHGRNLMGSYKDKVSYEERWNVIHYIRSLQAKELKLTYNQLENTLNSVDQPAGPNYMADNSMMDEEVSEDHQEEGMHHDAETHGEDTHMNEDAHTDEHSDESHGH